MTVNVNVVVLAGTVAAEPVERQMPSGDVVTEFRIRVPEVGQRPLPLPVAALHADADMEAIRAIRYEDNVLVNGPLVRRFYRSGAGARSVTEVVATDISKLESRGSKVGTHRPRDARLSTAFRLWVLVGCQPVGARRVGMTLRGSEALGANGSPAGECGMGAGSGDGAWVFARDAVTPDELRKPAFPLLPGRPGRRRTG